MTILPSRLSIQERAIVRKMIDTAVLFKPLGCSRDNFEILGIRHMFPHMNSWDKSPGDSLTIEHHPLHGVTYALTLVLALCRRYGLRPFRYHRQRRNTVMIRASLGFVDKVLLPEFTELARSLQVYLHEVTPRVIRDESMTDDTRDAQEVTDALPSN
ncbi:MULTISPECIES: hypothetical protein [unclassified Bradyrhizobium]|uniref:hypothetical protein n=1 Tax=unclassified Bradyrhizobium TaxID=2631580 RepID=UPI001CD7C1E0|nr:MULTISPECIES: hypothetical protein [unclassified Bradyrhizobium]